MKHLLITFTLLSLCILSSEAQQTAVHFSYGYSQLHSIGENGTAANIAVELPITKYLNIVPMAGFSGSENQPGMKIVGLQYEELLSNYWYEKNMGVGVGVYKQLGKHRFTFTPGIKYSTSSYVYSAYVSEDIDKYEPELKNISENGPSFIYGASLAYALRIFPRWHLGFTYSRSFNMINSNVYQHGLSGTLSFIVTKCSNPY